MSPRYHPELRRLARLVPEFDLTATALQRSRRPSVVLDRLQVRRARGVPVIAVDEHASVRLHRPDAGVVDGRAVLWIHGGGYVIGSAVMDDRVCRAYARRLSATVASVEYRLAPEHPHPAPLEDCYAALLWLAARPDVDPTKIVIAGASAGGGLASALALLARDRGEVAPAAQLLVYPMLDDRTCLRTDRDGAHRLWSIGSNRFGWRSYLGREPGSPDVPAYAAAARAESLAGLPPTWIGVGDEDLFHDEDLAYAERLRAADVPVTLEVVPGAFHGFDMIAPKKSVSRAFFDSQVEAVLPYLS